MPLLFNGTTLSRCNSRCDPKANLCSAVPNALLNTLPPRGVLQRRYYIYGHGAFNFSDVLSALQARMAGQPMDLALPVGEAQYLSDIPIMAALEKGIRFAPGMQTQPICTSSARCPLHPTCWRS